MLYYRGQSGENGQKEALAIVGSRRATAYGKSAARRLAEQLAERGIIVVSGLALGIDSAAHQGALTKEAVTWAFLGCGLDRIYPAENRKLAEEIVKKGALISEYPPGTPPEAAHFPARNRLISGCARGVVVVEAAQRSGALITVDFALEQGREVFAVPGSIFSEQSKGAHHLLKSGAKLVEGVEDIWSEIPGWEQFAMLPSSGRQQHQAQSTLSLSPEHEQILDLLSDEPLHIDQMILKTPLSSEKISLILLELEFGGKILHLPGQYYVLSR